MFRVTTIASACRNWIPAASSSKKVIYFLVLYLFTASKGFAGYRRTLSTMPILIIFTSLAVRLLSLFFYWEGGCSGACMIAVAIVVITVEASMVTIMVVPFFEEFNRVIPP